MELLGITDAALVSGDGIESGGADVAGRADEGVQANGTDYGIDHWDAAERETLKDNIKARRPFLDFVMHRRRADGSQQRFRISGEPLFDRNCRFRSYRGLGVEGAL